MIHLINNEKELKSKGFDMLIDVKLNFKNPFIKYIMYEKENTVVGYLCFEDIYDRYEIDDLLVYDRYRGNGIGSKLMEHLIKLATEKKVNNITLEVRKDNNIAINLYKKYGFKDVAIRENYYNGIDGILMKKEM